MPLTNLAVQNAKPREKSYKITDGGGMYLEVAPNGGKYWRLKYRFLNKEKRLALGVYPEISLADARERRAAARKLLANGIDPGEKKRADKRQAYTESENTFERVARQWFTKKEKELSPGYASDMIKRIEKDIFPFIGQRPINSLTSLDIIEVLQRAEQRGVGELAHRLKQNCHEIFRYAVVHELAKTNPVANFETRDVLSKHTKSHFASIEAKEIPAFLDALERNDARLYRLTRLAIRLMMITFVRTGELIKATWSEIDLEERQWNIPAERMKMRRPHVVPLSHQAMSLLAELKELAVSHNDFIFPSVSNPRKSMSDNTILQGLSRLGYKGKMTGHGFRAMAMSTIKEKLGYRHEVIDRQLAHAPKNKIVAAYDRAQFLDERKTMMQDWADYIDQQAKQGKAND